MFHDFLLIFIPLFVAVDTAGVLPLFLALTEHYPEARRRSIARRATVVAAVVGLVFIVVGQAIFTFLGIHFADFQIAGGVLLFLLSVVDLLSSRSKPAIDEHALLEHPETTLGTVPLAVPLIVGPATLTTSLLLVNTHSPRYALWYGPSAGPILVETMVAAALVLNLVILFIAMWYSSYLVRLVGKNTMLVINKIVMILLAAIAVALIRQGITSIVKGLQ